MDFKKTYASMINVQDAVCAAFPEKKLSEFSFREGDNGAITIMVQMKNKEMPESANSARIEKLDDKLEEETKRQRLAEPNATRHPIKMSLKISRKREREGDDEVRVLSKIMNIDGVVTRTEFADEDDVNRERMVRMSRERQVSPPIDLEAQESWESTMEEIEIDQTGNVFKAHRNAERRAPTSLKPCNDADASFGQE